ncbi:MAG: OB-fold nucleic acid binding domain-containing protein [Candidatus Methylomirabilia bacterium]
MSLARFSSVLPFLLCLAVLIILSPAAAVRAQEQEPEVTLPACGIRYPGGYDPNTVGVVEGRVAAFARPEQGPISFRLEAAGETYAVLAAPAWFWEDRKITIANGDRVRVKGSKTMGADGNLYLVAREITVSGAEKPEVLRDARGKPVWSGCGPGGCGRRGQR